MSKFFKVAIVGAGNVGWHLAGALEDAGHFITDIYSHYITTAHELAQRLYDTNVTSSLDLRKSEAEIFLLAVSDDALEDVVVRLKIPAYAIIAHTSGTQSLEVLSNHHDNSGIFYPLQTFTKGVSVDLKEVPICIEAANQSTKKILHLLGCSISDEVHAVNSSDRKVLHIGAVFASNFGNYMLTIAQDILEDHDIDFGLLHPLIIATVNKALAVGPVESQTGPAKRGDKSTLQTHLNFLKYQPKYRKIYKLISDHLKESYS